jgi:transposase
MPWEREDEMVLKTRFAHEFNAPNSNKSEICRRYGVSRDTGYRLARKYHQLGEAGLPRASSAPLTHPNEVSNDAIEHLLALRAASPGASWAATKLLRFWDETVPRSHEY